MHQKAIPFKRGNTIELSMWFGIAPGSGIDSLIGVKPVCRLRPRHAREAVAEFEVHTRPENRLLLTLGADKCALLKEGDYIFDVLFVREADGYAESSGDVLIEIVRETSRAD